MISTLEEFYAAVKSLGLTWELDHLGHIHPKGLLSVCPRTALTGEHTFAPYFLRYHVDTIYAAADNQTPHDPKIRKELLEACGLEAE